MRNNSFDVRVYECIGLCESHAQFVRLKSSVDGWRGVVEILLYKSLKLSFPIIITGLILISYRTKTNIACGEAVLIYKILHTL